MILSSKAGFPTHTYKNMEIVTVVDVGAVDLNNISLKIAPRDYTYSIVF